jgi:hypothetical protein
MPQPVAQLEEPLAVVGRDDLAVPVEVGEIAHAGAEAAFRRLADGARPLLDLKRPEDRRKGDLLLVGDVLVVEDQHAVSVHARVDRVSIRATQRLPQVDARHFAGEGWRDRFDCQRHALFLPELRVIHPNANPSYPFATTASQRSI